MPLAVLTLMNTALGLYCQPTTIRSGAYRVSVGDSGALNVLVCTPLVNSKTISPAPTS